MNRDYFMYIDHKGQLFLEETEPKNYVTCIKDPKFFVLFFSNFNISNISIDIWRKILQLDIGKAISMFLNAGENLTLSNVI